MNSPDKNLPARRGGTLATLSATLAQRFGMGDSPELLDTLKATAFKGNATDAQMTALLIVANQYGLNPFTKEIYAFPDKNNGIVPVVGVDGWARIINEHPQFDGMDFEQDAESCTCRMHRKDRGHPIAITEYKAECSRNVGPWQSHPRRMLRHKAMIQCARLSFGYVGIYDQDEAERIIEKDITAEGEVLPREKPGLPAYPAEAFAKVLAKWRESGTKSPEDFAAMLATKGVLSAEQKSEIAKGRNVARAEPKPAASAGNGITYAQVAEQINKASDMDLLDAAADLIGEVADQTQRAELNELYNERQAALGE